MEKIQQVKNKTEDEKPFSLKVVSIRLVKDAQIYSEQPFSGPKEAVTALNNILCELDREVVCVINLSKDLRPINVNFASIGTLDAALINPRELLKTSILSNAASIMLVHCHPSGDLSPSREDIMITDRMNKVCKMIGITLLDHIIAGGSEGKYFSFMEKGIISEEKLNFQTNFNNIDLKHNKEQKESIYKNGLRKNIR